MARNQHVEQLGEIARLRRLQKEAIAAKHSAAARALSLAETAQRSARVRLQEEEKCWERVLAGRAFDPFLAAFSAESIVACDGRFQARRAMADGARAEVAERSNELKAAIVRSEVAEAAAGRAAKNRRQLREEAALARLEDRLTGRSPSED